MRYAACVTPIKTDIMETSIFSPDTSALVRHAKCCSPPTDGGCINWIGKLSRDGYGIMSHRGKLIIASRFALAAATRTLPDRKIHAAHSCNNRACQNPAHLEWKTAKENQHDRIANGTNARRGAIGGIANRLTPKRIAKIRADTRSHRLVAADFGVTPMNISYIKRNKSFRNV
jgi:hypothetical protein